MFSQIKEVAIKADLKPGTIIQTEAAKDSFNATGKLVLLMLSNVPHQGTRGLV